MNVVEVDFRDPAILRRMLTYSRERLHGRIGPIAGTIGCRDLLFGGLIYSWCNLSSCNGIIRARSK